MFCGICGIRLPRNRIQKGFGMSISLRIILIVCSVITLIFVPRKIRRASLRIGDGIVWILISVFFILISIFPEIIYWFCGLVGIISPANFVYLLILAFLLMQQFYAALRISSLESRVDQLAQEVALRDGRFMHIETADDRTERADVVKRGTDTRFSQVNQSVIDDRDNR